MKILVIGGGGREHALVWKLKQSPLVEKIWCAPGNGGIAAEADCEGIDPGDVSTLVTLARNLSPDLTVVGPELPLVNGIVDAFTKNGCPIVGPSQQAAQLEGSKIFSKQFLQRHNIPTATVYGVYDSAPNAYAALSNVQWPLVIKADGLCAGKGVFLAPDSESAKDFISRVLEKKELGAGGERILLEETLKGDELSFMILTDGQRYAPLVPTRDHKRVFDGDLGPNTGGMGAFSTDDLLPPDLRDAIVSKIIQPTLHGLAADGIRYQGILYVGLMLTNDGPKVLEFNCRLGDPETQAIVARMDFDLAEVLMDLANYRLDPSKLRWKPGASASIVLASGGYPGKFSSGKPIEGLTAAEQITGLKVLHSGTIREGTQILTRGGRVLGVTAVGPTLESALATAYSGVDLIHFAGMHFRKDIGAHGSRVQAAGD
jgi:phosphoribosylamine--glycine ligase